MKRLQSTVMLWLLLGLILAACNEDDTMPTLIPTVSAPEDGVGGAEPTSILAVETPLTATEVPDLTPPSPTETPAPPKELVICMGDEPENLYLYGDDSLQATAVRHAIYENLYTTLGYAYQAQGLLKIPDLAAGDAAIISVDVGIGDQIVNSSGDIVRLAPGVQLITADGEFLIVGDEEEGPITMQQMVVDFAFHPLVWSDGTPVTADDSVFSFAIAADPATPVDKTLIDRTAAYEATGELAVRWTGLPGFLDSTYFTNVWPPMPRHQLGGMTPDELLAAAETNRVPLSNGPFVIATWESSVRIELEKNPHYYRQSEGFPLIDNVTILFHNDEETALDNIISGVCDVATHDVVNMLQTPTLLEAQAGGHIQSYFQTTTVFEHIDFGINSFEEYGDGNRHGRPDWFEDAQVRRAMTMCTDRQRMIDELMFGQSTIMHAYIPDTHPLYPDKALVHAYDPEAANALLDEAGFVDTDEDGIRELVEMSQGEIVNTTPFSVTLGTNSESDIRLRINQIFQENMRDCGIHVVLYDLPADDWYADGPFSPLFGRRFDLATFAWRSHSRPPCSLYLSFNVTGPEERGFGGWSNINATGWSNEAYDQACAAALAALPGTPDYIENHQEAALIFSEQVPMIPLFSYINVAATRPGVLNFELDITQPSELWNIYAWDVEE